MYFKNIKIYHKDVPINQQLNELKKVNKNIFYLLTLLLGYLPMETEQWKRLRKDMSAKNNPFKSTCTACTGCLHYNKVYTTKYGIHSFKYQGVKILNHLKKINIYQNIQILEKIKIQLRSLIVLSCRFFLSISF